MWCGILRWHRKNTSLAAGADDRATYAGLLAALDICGAALAFAEVFVEMNEVHAEEFIPELRVATAGTSASVRRGFPGTDGLHACTKR